MIPIFSIDYLHEAREQPIKNMFPPNHRKRQTNANGT
nr:MAG TPA: hypothetical protein [Caudoviricetes sp.]